MIERPKRKRDWEGRYVKLLRTLEMPGGKIYSAGMVMQVTRNWNGLHLQNRIVCEHCGVGDRNHISKVPEHWVELLPKSYRE